MTMSINGGGVMAPTLGPNWAEMTRECLLDIFSRLSQEERWMRPMLVCKTWMNTCHEPSLNTIFDLETRFQSYPESINWWTLEFEDKVDAFLRSVVDWSEGGLTEIRVRHCSDRSLSYVAERCPKLEVLWIKSCPHVTGESMAKIATNCPNLRELDVSYSYCISHESLSMLGRHCPNLEILKRNLFPRQGPNVSMIVAPVDYIRAFPRYGNIEAQIIGRHMTRLKHLELQYCTMTVKGLTSVCKGCTNLEYLDLSGCLSLTNSEITRFTSTLKNLMEIKKPDFNRPVDILRIPRNDN